MSTATEKIAGELITDDPEQFHFAIDIRIRNQGVRGRRVALKLSQAQLAERVGVSVNHISQIECMRTRPGNDLRDRLATAPRSDRPTGRNG